MNTCGTCKYFGAQRPEIINDGDQRRVPSEYKWCGFMHMDEILDESKRPIAFVIDGSGYYAALCVKEDFGCNQWSQAETGAKP